MSSIDTSLSPSFSDTKSEKKKRGNYQIRMTTSLRGQQEWNSHNSHHAWESDLGVDQPGFGWRTSIDGTLKHYHDWNKIEENFTDQMPFRESLYLENLLYFDKMQV